MTSSPQSSSPVSVSAKDHIVAKMRSPKSNWSSIGLSLSERELIVAAVRSFDFAQRQQEPVAWRFRHVNYVDWSLSQERPKRVGLEVEPLFTLSDTSTVWTEQDLAEAKAEAKVLSDHFKTWPSGCYDPDSCARHFGCMYVQCKNMKRDGNELAQEIRAVLVTSPERGDK